MQKETRASKKQTRPPPKINEPFEKKTSETRQKVNETRPTQSFTLLQPVLVFSRDAPAAVQPWPGRQAQPAARPA